MKTFSNAVLGELRAPGCNISAFIKLEIPGGDTIYLGGKDFALADGTAVTGRVIGYPQITSKINWLDSNLEDSGFTIELSNQPTGSAWQTLIEQFESIDVHTVKAHIIILVAGEQIGLFAGYVERIDDYTEATVTISIRRGLSHVDTFLGTLIDETTWAGPITDESRGLMMPLIWGLIKNCPTIRVTAPWEAILRSDLSSTATGWIHLDDFKANMSIPTPNAAFIGEELIRYDLMQIIDGDPCIHVSHRGYDHTKLSQKEHRAGEKIIQWRGYAEGPSYSRYLVAGHRCNLLSNVKVDGVPAPSTDYAFCPDAPYPKGLDGKMALIRFNRNATYPDVSGSTKTMKIYFGRVTTANTCSGAENIIEDAEGQGQNSSSEPTILNPSTILDIDIHNRGWESAGSSLGKIKSVKMIIKHRTNSKPVVMDKIGANADDPSVRLYSRTENWLLTSLDKPFTEGDSITETIQPRSGQTYFNRYCEWGDYPARRIWNGATDDYSYGVNSAGFAIATHHDVGGGNTGIMDVRVNITRSSLSSRNITCIKISTLTLAPSQIDSVRMYAYDEDSGMVYRRTVTTQPSWPLSRQTETIPIPSSLYNFPSHLGIRAHDHSATPGLSLFFSSDLSIEYTYKELNKSRVTQEYDVTSYYTEWDDFNDAKIVIIAPNANNYRGLWLEVYAAYFEVEYYPFRPFDKSDVTCTVEGRTGYSYLNSSGEYPGAVMRDIISNWLLSKTNLSGLTLDVTSFEGYPSETYVDYRIETRESVLSVLKQLAYENRRWLTFDNLEFKLIRRPHSWGGHDWAITDNDIVWRTFKVIPASVIDLITSLDYKAKYNHADRTWGIVETLPPVASDVGEKSMTLELASHCNSDDATVPQYYLDMFSAEHDLYSFRVKTEGLKIEVGDVINVSYSPLGISSVNIYVLSVGVWPGDLWAGTVPYIEITGVV